MDKHSLALSILKYWYFLEFLGQPDFPSQGKSEKTDFTKSAIGKSDRKQISVFQALKFEELTHKTSPHYHNVSPIAEAIGRQNQNYRNFPILSDEIELCIGKIKRSTLAEKLKQVFDPSREFPEKRESYVAVIGLKCNPNGCYIPNSLNVSPLAWGVHRLITRENNSDLTNLLSIDAYRADMARMESLLLSEENRLGEVLTSQRIKRIMVQIYQEHLSSILDSFESVLWDGVLINRRYVSEEVQAENDEEFRESDLFHSFFSEDLLLVSKAISEGKIGNAPMQQALINYICSPYAEAHPELGWNDSEKRVNVFDRKGCDATEQTDLFHDWLDITRAPLGKWPSRFRPGLMQQLAINLCWASNPENQAIFSVNGPPGTGKTTLLKEIIAGNIVARAYRLAQYKLPDDAFEKKNFQDGDKAENGYSKFYNAYYRFRDNSLKDYGILVASSNNLAVENITKELPNIDLLLSGVAADKKDDPKIAQGLQETQKLFDLESAAAEVYQVWDTDVNRFEPRKIPDIYFTKLANDLTNNLLNRSPAMQDRWGLISAPFGKVSNLKSYIYNVLKPYVRSFGENKFIDTKAKEYSLAAERFLEQYQKVADLQRSIAKISGARSCYLKEKREHDQQIKTEEIELEALKQAELELQNEIGQLHETIESTEKELICCQNEALSLYNQKGEQEEKQHILKIQIEDIRKQIIALEQSRRFWDYLLDILRRPTMLSKEIQEKYNALEHAKEKMKEQEEITEQALRRYIVQQDLCRVHKKHISQSRASCIALENRQMQNAEQQDKLLKKIQECHRKINEAHLTYRTLLRKASACDPEHRIDVLDEDFISHFNSENEEESCKAHISNPWQSAKYDREREKLFYEALRLHKAFLLGSKCCLWNFKNLLLFWNEPGDDKEPVRISERDRKAAFGDLLNTVFLLTPVLSSTFASVGTMLSPIDKPGEIGCLIIDEAGQASPQMAVGAIFRSRRAIVVGDPRQVEPVITDETDLIKRIVRNEKTQYYQDKSLSVQGFADRLNQIGTYYTDGSERLWVGCPLVVHRRCISPMFDISNALSYSHIMKQQTKLPSPEKEKTFCKENSGWINICGSEQDSTAKDHYVQTQGKKAWEMIIAAFKKADGKPSLFVITPFTSVKEGFIRMISTQPEYKKDFRIQEWAHDCIGTVHSFQGREADQVIFLLGCDKNGISAVRWVNSNIVNVAVTRAKYRLYIIGDYLVWKESQIFCNVKGILDSYAIRILHQIVRDGGTHTDLRQVEYLLKQMPDADSLTVEGEPDDRLLSPLLDKMALLLKNATLTREQWEAFGFSQEDVEQLSKDIQKHLSEGIFQHSILTAVKTQYQVELSDASGSGIMFCKVMEMLLKEQFLEKFKTYFSNMTQHHYLLKASPDRVTTGNFSNILMDAACQKILASKGAVLSGCPCDATWWDIYAKRLEDFRKLRNICCHSEPLHWDQYEQLLQILFMQREFMNTMVGTIMPE